MPEIARRIRLLPILSIVSTLAAQSVPPTPYELQLIPEVQTNTKVVLGLDHGIELLDSEGLGFRISVSGWEPKGVITIYAVGTKGEQVPIIPKERVIQVSPDGSAILDVHYERKGFHPGNWAILVAGASGAHVFQMQIPRVEPPSPGQSSWKLDFKAATEYEKTVSASEKK